MLPKPAFITREWPVGREADVRVILTETYREEIYTSVSIASGTDWEHVTGSAVRHLSLAEAEDRAEMLLQGAALKLVARLAGSDPDEVPRTYDSGV
jgi:hypothetical protein